MTSNCCYWSFCSSTGACWFIWINQQLVINLFQSLDSPLQFAHRLCFFYLKIKKQTSHKNNNNNKKRGEKISKWKPAGNQTEIKTAHKKGRKKSLRREEHLWCEANGGAVGSFNTDTNRWREDRNKHMAWGKERRTERKKETVGNVRGRERRGRDDWQPGKVRVGGHGTLKGGIFIMQWGHTHQHALVYTPTHTHTHTDAAGGRPKLHKWQNSSLKLCSMCSDLLTFGRSKDSSEGGVIGAREVGRRGGRWCTDHDPSE